MAPFPLTLSPGKKGLIAEEGRKDSTLRSWLEWWLGSGGNQVAQKGLWSVWLPGRDAQDLLTYSSAITLNFDYYYPTPARPQAVGFIVAQVNMVSRIN